MVAAGCEFRERETRPSKSNVVRLNSWDGKIPLHFVRRNFGAWPHRTGKSLHKGRSGILRTIYCHLIPFAAKEKITGRESIVITIARPLPRKNYGPEASHYHCGFGRCQRKVLCFFFKERGSLRALCLPALPSSDRCHVKVLCFFRGERNIRVYRQRLPLDLDRCQGKKRVGSQSLSLWLRSLPRKSSLLLSFKKEGEGGNQCLSL